MSDELVFYTHPQSRGRTVRWMLEEIGQPYRTELLEYAGSMKAPEYLAINPMGKVPAIRHGDVVVTEAAAICAYLADAFPQAGLAPPLGDKRRGPYFRWMFFASGPLEAAAISRAMNWQAPPERKPMLGYGCYEDAVNAIEQAVQPGGYILGETFSAADLYFGSAVGFFMDFGLIEKRPSLVEYVARLRSRPAFLRSIEIDGATSSPSRQPENA